MLVGILMSDPTQEAESRTINLDDDTADGVNLLLEFLYTLQIPTWGSGTVAFATAERAFFLGDKYGVPSLRDAGLSKLKEYVTNVTEAWVKYGAGVNVSWVNRFDGVWSWDQEGSGALRETIISALLPISKTVIELVEFQDLVWKNRDFGLAFMRAITAERLVRVSEW